MMTTARLLPILPALLVLAACGTDNAPANPDDTASTTAAPATETVTASTPAAPAPEPAPDPAPLAPYAITQPPIDNGTSAAAPTGTTAADD